MATRYGVIVADPPWQYANRGCRGAAEIEYSTLDTDAICALPVRELVADDAVLFLWTTWPKIQDALRVVTAWGFEYVTGLPWVKIIGKPSMDLWGALRVHPRMGVGFWIRGCTEPLLICRRGHVSPPVDAFVGLLCENTEHSRKPENIYHIAEQLPGPWLELFARRRRDGWDVWGDEVGHAESNQIMACDAPRERDVLSVPASRSDVYPERSLFGDVE